MICKTTAVFDRKTGELISETIEEVYEDISECLAPLAQILCEELEVTA